MSVDPAAPSPEDFVAALTLESVNRVLLRAERHSDEVVSGVQMTTELLYGVNGHQVAYRAVSHLGLVGESGPVADLDASVVVVFAVAEGLAQGWEELVPAAGGLALMAAHPYLRESFTSLAGSVGLPPTTVGLLRAGNSAPDTVAVGSALFSVAPTDADTVD